MEVFPCSHVKRRAVILVSLSLFAEKIDIQALRVRCSNAERNCEWEGTVGTLEEHVAVCEFALVPCPKECKDNSGVVKHFIKNHADEHLHQDCPNRDYACEHCGKNGTYAEITQVHDAQCDLVPCPACSAIIARNYIEEHAKDKCKNTVVPCKFQSIGCKLEMEREKMETHEDDDKFHFHMALEAVVRLQGAYTELEDTKTKLQDTSTTTIKLQTTNTKLQDANVKLQDENTELKAANNKLKDVNSILQCVNIKLQSLSNTVAAMKQVSDTIETKIRTLVKGEPIAFSVSDYLKKKTSNELFVSAPFYTHAGGYQMAIRVCINGVNAGKGTHVSVHVLLLRGKYDARLKWPFVGTLAYTLLNQLDENNHYTRTLSIETAHNARVGGASGFLKFIPHSALANDISKNTWYLKDGTLYFSVEVKVTDHKPWLECSM